MPPIDHYKSKMEILFHIKSPMTSNRSRATPYDTVSPKYSNTASKQISLTIIIILDFFTVSYTPWGRVTHICVSKQTIISSDNGLLPGRRQAIIWNNAGILLIGTLGNFSEILSKIHTSSFKKIHLKISSVKWRPFCPGRWVNKYKTLRAGACHYCCAGELSVVLEKW